MYGSTPHLNFIKKIILFTGNISKLTGIIDFALLFNEISNSNFELHIYGKGYDEILKNLSEKNSSIKIFGFVNDEVLENAMRSAWIYVNPRSISEETLQNTFPSKILEYLRYGKPILSTKSSGIGNKYDSFLFYYNSEDFKIKDFKNNSWSFILYSVYFSFSCFF